jgi:hypothetical protein
MKRGEVARRLISEGECAFRMFAAVIWPGRDWAEDALQAKLVACPACAGVLPGCGECANTGLVSTSRLQLLTGEASVAYG